ncbi:MAG: hypothetical protein ACRD0U_16790 [Acidimicrobiales bacterium]
MTPRHPSEDPRGDPPAQPTPDDGHDQGGDPACWAHLFDQGAADPGHDTEPRDRPC